MIQTNMISQPVDELETFLDGRHQQYYEQHQTDELENDVTIDEDGGLLGLYVNEARLACEMSQIELADATGIPVTDIYALELGIYRLDEIDEEQMARLWQVLEPPLAISDLTVPTTDTTSLFSFGANRPRLMFRQRVTRFGRIGRQIITTRLRFSYVLLVLILVIGARAFVQQKMDVALQNHQTSIAGLLFAVPPPPPSLSEALFPPRMEGFDGSQTDGFILGASAPEPTYLHELQSATTQEGFAYSRIYVSPATDATDSAVKIITADSNQYIPTTQETAEVTSTTAIRKTGLLSLTPTADSTAKQIANQIKQIVQARGGYILNEQTEAGQKEHKKTVLELSLPPDAFDMTWERLHQISGIVILAEDVSRENISDVYIDLNARLKNAQLQETELQEFLDAAREEGHSVSDVLRISDRLSEAREVVERLQGQLNLLEESISQSHITVLITPFTEEATAQEPEVDDRQFRVGAIFQEAWGSFIQVMQFVLSIVIWGLVYSPIALFLAGVVWGIRRWLMPVE